MAQLLTQFLTLTFVASLLSPAAFAQTQSGATRRQDQVVIDQLIQEILTKAAELSGQQAAKVKLLTKGEQEAAYELSKATNAKEKAISDLARAREDVESANSALGHSRTQSADMAVLREYERTVRLMASAKAEVSQLAMQERSAQAHLEFERREKERAEQEMNQLETLRAQQRDTLMRLYNAWAANKTWENFAALTSQLTQLAATYSATSDVEFLTEDSKKNQTDGARINYESQLDRKNNVQPIKATNCTTVKPPRTPSCVKEAMPKGWYYIWSVREQGRVTSDKDYYTHVAGTKASITVKEDR